jgi:hypothetical protein
MAAAVVLLAAAVLLHFATPHHSATPPAAVSAVASAVEPESRKSYGPASVAAHAHTRHEHHVEAADAPAWLPRASQLLAEPAPLDRTAGDSVGTSTAPGPAQPRTARDAWNPAAGAAPTSSTLQTFRC